MSAEGKLLLPSDLGGRHTGRGGGAPSLRCCISFGGHLCCAAAVALSSLWMRPERASVALLKQSQASLSQRCCLGSLPPAQIQIPAACTKGGERRTGRKKPRAAWESCWRDRGPCPLQIQKRVHLHTLVSFPLSNSDKKEIKHQTGWDFCQSLAERNE